MTKKHSEPEKATPPPVLAPTASAHGRLATDEARGLERAVDVTTSATEPSFPPPLDPEVASGIDDAERKFQERQAKNAHEARSETPAPATPTPAPVVSAPPAPLVLASPAEAAIKAAAGLVDALAVKCASGGAAGLGELRQLERDIRALAQL